MPDRSRIVITNSTPIIALALIDQVELLRHLYTEVLIPPAVQAEVMAGGPSGTGIVQLRQADWLRTQASKRF